jgi:hypothetical protein
MDLLGASLRLSSHRKDTTRSDPKIGKYQIILTHLFTKLEAKIMGMLQNLNNYYHLVGVESTSINPSYDFYHSTAMKTNSHLTSIHHPFTKHWSLPPRIHPRQTSTASSASFACASFRAAAGAAFGLTGFQAPDMGKLDQPKW